MEKKTVIVSLIYKFLERTGYQGIAFIIQIILARLLTPSDYGVLTMLTIFITISQVFVQSGLNTALIQKKKVDEVDYSSVFYVSLGIAVVLYIVLFIASPYIASFYNMPELSNILKVLALILIPGAFNSIQNAIVAREMQFKKLLYSTMAAVIISGSIGIGMAYAALGTWSLVGQQLSNQIVACLVLMFLIKWYPKRCFSFVKVKELFSFGWKLLCSNLIDTIYTNLQSLVIGKKYDAATLGFFNRGKQFPQILVENINGSVQSIMLPTLSQYQDEKRKLKSLTRRAIVTSSVILFPLLIGLAVISKPLISLILTDKWLPCVPYMWIYCINYIFMPIHTANLQAINAQGRSDQFLKLEIIKKSYGLIVLVITVILFDTPIAIALGMLVTTLISCFVNAYPNKKLLNYSYKEQIRDILPAGILAIVMGVVIFPISLIELPDLLTIILQVISGSIIYIVLNRIFKIEGFLYLWNMAKEYIANFIHK